MAFTGDFNGTRLESTVSKVAGHLADVWSSSGTFWNRHWAVIHDVCNGDTMILTALGKSDTPILYEDTC